MQKKKDLIDKARENTFKFVSNLLFSTLTSQPTEIHG